MSAFVRQRLRALLVTMSKEDLVVLKELIEAGKVTPVISAHYPLSEAPEAIRHFEEGHGQGKIVITVGGRGPAGVSLRLGSALGKQVCNRF